MNGMYRMNRNIKGIEEPAGYVDGAEFREIKPYIPYFQDTITVYKKVPWLGTTKLDKFYMNTYKMLNQPPVQTYKELRFTSIPWTNYEKVEGFGNNNILYITLIIILVIILYQLIK